MTPACEHPKRILHGDGYEVCLVCKRVLHEARTPNRPAGKSPETDQLAWRWA